MNIRPNAVTAFIGGDKIAVQITPVAESADEILEYDYKATVIQKAFAFKTISFERAAK